ncbi:amidohydrolase family protein [Aspergillus novofumigatus IBT 16806]|uniref:2,3-dihydroxybenzoic acid decarboxylase n=1 Tax=Aspergillus novofumigatus (strain IBT 16806) TaxID=1392255 RepID=A0A2I1C5E8_ASPN1|nr:2,3-dihydroxybenzoic acid decarboxylase [Aspergillus novofumigatus IBT 16806]PKX92900.1 2,3-dihydroxybenzoic acid decarboxylase [Aspergillus novofumigatus IBT 16806]
MASETHFLQVASSEAPGERRTASQDFQPPLLECFSLREPRSKLDTSLYIDPWDRERYVRQIHDITREPLQSCNEHGIGYTVVSLTVPGIHGIADKTEAETAATLTNNWIAEQIKETRDCLGAFACLSIDDPVQAGQVLRRCVKDLGFHGALLCDFQHAGSSGETYLFYNQPQYGAFWDVLTGLEIPLYTHPAAPADVILEELYSQRPFLIGPPLSFANGVSLHTLGLISNGVFDRFPTAKVIIGHLGEHIPFDFCRINHWFEDDEKPIAEEKDKIIGHFSTATFFKCVVDEIGADCVLFSIDYPFETIENGCGWWDNGAEAIKEAVGGVGLYRCSRLDNAKKPLKLGDFDDSEAPVN